MAVQVETLDKLERRITLTLPAATISLRGRVAPAALSRTVKADGFRPGKVPMSVVAQRYGYSVHNEVMNDKVGQVFSRGRQRGQAARRRRAAHHREGRRAGGPGRVRRDLRGLSRGQARRPGDRRGRARHDRGRPTRRSTRRSTSCASSAARSRSARPAEPAADGDRVTIDFEGKVDGVPFDGGKAEDFQFVIGEGQMLEQFDAAVRGMKTGESKTFPLQFPADYQGKDVAGKEADFMVTLKKIEAQHLPEVDEAFAKSLGIGGRHGRGAARRRPEEPRARGEVPRAGAQQGERDGRAGQGRRARRAEGAGRRRDRADDRGRRAPT